MATDLSRRALLATALGVVACRGAVGQPAEDAALVAIETSARSGLSRARWFSQSGAALASTALDFRAHGLATDPSGPLVAVFARRPGNRVALVNRDSLEIAQTITAAPARHFYGHGAFSRDGQTLLAPQNNVDTLRGSLAVYTRSATRFTLTGEIPLPAAGPHEIIRAPGADRFLIALGGLETHPDYGRTPFNLADFRSQILSLDLTSARPEPMGHWADTEGISLRHLAVDDAGRIYVGGQIKNPARAGTEGPVLWLLQDGTPTPIDAGRSLKGYVSSVAASGSAAYASSKSSGLILKLDGTRLLKTTQRDGASALAAAPGLTAAAGLTLLSLNGTAIDASDLHEFDNHAAALAPV